VQAVPDSIRLTPGGAHPSEAPASLMARAVDKDDDSFEQYCAREFGAMTEAFAGGRVVELADLPVTGTWKALQVSNDQRMAIVTLIEQEQFFVWFGILVSDLAQAESMTSIYREALQSFGQTAQQ
jgi:hypothetical protein